MNSKPFLICSLLTSFCCHGPVLSENNPENRDGVADTDLNPYGNIGAIPLPAGFERPQQPEASFGNWLLGVKLKKDKTVYLFDGRPKAFQAAQFAVLDISVGDNDLQQCADAVMRLRAEYLFAAKRYDEIAFTDNAAKTYRFSEPYTAAHLQIYLQQVFNFCGSASLSKQLHNIALKDIAPGDVFVHGGFPGHAEIVLEVVVNKAGQKNFLLAQSYMPAQDIHVLINPADKLMSPWYEYTGQSWLETPEFDFRSNELKTW